MSVDGGLELWTGPEASHTRTDELTLDQLDLSGFGSEQDWDRLASLGVTRVRMPVLWERVMPAAPEDADWAWSDRALRRLGERGVLPIAGLLHHGSGPEHTSLLDPAFPGKLADYARRVAERYPGLDAWTPVNEPLTTARFSALYSHWYPHARSSGEFIQALLNELRGTVLAMRAVREVNPAAQLIQTEDLGKVYATPGQRRQADFENERRWLSFDLLCGRVDQFHPLWGFLRWAGADERELLWFAEHACPPDVLGLNVYPTSERFLDERLERYPAEFHGGGEGGQYADLEAVRVRGALPGGFFQRLMEAHERYHLPLAVTEVHLGCTREEQLRWLNQSWGEAERARQNGADVRALTVWAAYGSFEWNSLLTRQSGHYEPGLWDVSGSSPELTQPEPRETALAALARQLVAGQQPDHPVLAGPGWWQRSRRLLYPPEGEVEALAPRGKPLLLVGSGPQGRLLRRLCHQRGLPFRTLSVGGDSRAAAGRTQAWARLEFSSPTELRFRRLDLPRAAGPLTIRVDAPSAWRHHLNRALDLFLDGERGEWQLQHGQLAPRELELATPERQGDGWREAEVGSGD